MARRGKASPVSDDTVPGPAGVLDRLGVVVAEEQRLNFNTLPAWQEARRLLDDAVRLSRDLAAGPGGGLLDAEGVAREVAVAVARLRAARSFAQCSRCTGAGCGACSGRGWVPESEGRGGAEGGTD